MKRHYRAFISYSHADRAVAQWLHRALETYRLPRHLVGQETAIGPVPARLTPIFRDRDELSAAGNLSDELREALRESDFLIVVASPSAAQSHWVNEETRLFKQMHGATHVLALIADGEAGARGSAGAFPPALRFHVDADGSITDQRAEPIAADLRPGADGKRLAKLKLVAGLTGLPLDALVQREAQRRQRWLAGIAAASLGLVAVMAVLTVFAIQGQREAERQRAEADGLIEFMLTDLRQKLEPVGRLDALDAVGQRAMAYYGGQNPARLDPDALGRRARALMLVGEVRDLRGNGAGAIAAYTEAEATTAELLARDAENPDRMYDHAQSLFYVGQLAWQRGEWATAEDRFRRYVALADAMVAADPANPKWQAEVGYAANSLGALLLERGQPGAAVAEFTRYAAVTGRLMAAKPKETAAAWEHSQARAWLADAHYRAGDTQKAREERGAELAILSTLRAADPRDSNIRMSETRARQAMAEIAIVEGRTAEALEEAGIAMAAAEALLRLDPANNLWRQQGVAAANSRTEALVLTQQWTEADAANRWALARAPQAIGGDRDAARWQVTLLMPARAMEIAILFGQRRRNEARAAIDRFHADFGKSRTVDVTLGANWPRAAVALMAASDRVAAGDAASAKATAVAAIGSAADIRTRRDEALAAALAALAEGRAVDAPPQGYPAHVLAASAGP